MTKKNQPILIIGALVIIAVIIYLFTQTDKKVADAITRYLIGDRKQAIRQLAMLASKINVDIDQERYNSQYSDTHRAIMKVLKRVM